jgi:hypothetical protein
MTEVGPIGDPQQKGTSQGLRTPTYPYVAPHPAKIQTLTTLRIGSRTKRLVFKARMRRPCGVAALFAGLVGTIIFLLGKKVISFEKAILVLVALLAMYVRLKRRPAPDLWNFSLAAC